MNELLGILGFTTPLGIFWNSVGYCAFIAIIAGVFFEKGKTLLFLFGALALVPYAYIYLGNTLLTVLQIIVALSAFLSLLRAPRWLSHTVALGFGFCASGYFFAVSGMDLWTIFGALGLVFIAVGVTQV